MKKTLLAGLATGLGFIIFAGSAYALPVSYHDGTTNVTSGITSYSATGENMAGMQVTATFNDGTKDAKTWESDGVGTDSGGVTGTNSNWSLTQSGDSMGVILFGDINNGGWIFEGPSNITNLTIDAGPGRTVFDVLAKPDIGTPGSSFGRAIAIGNNYTNSWAISATYSGQVALSGSQPVGDLYRYLSIDFNTSGNLVGKKIEFLADTDKTAGSVSPVPEPATMLLFGAGLAGIAGTMQRRKKNA